MFTILHTLFMLLKAVRVCI